MKNIITIILGTVAAFLLAVCVVIVMVSDREAPKIQMQPMDISYSEGEDTQVLIQGITAYDDRDGEVTDSVLVKEVVALNNGKQAKVVYVARDKSNNISESCRIVDYVKNDESEYMPLDDMYAETLMQDGIYGEDSAEDEEITEDAGVEEPSEETAEETSEEIKETENKEEQSKTEEKPKAEEKPADNDKAPKLTLKQSSITLKPGQAIDPMSLIKTKTNVTKVTVDGDVNLNIPGTYNMVYTASGTDGKTATANLKIIVAQ